MRVPDSRKLPSNEDGHFISATCGGEPCGPCFRQGVTKPATHKLGEEIPYDDPNQMRHNLSQYVCCTHYVLIVGSHAANCPEVKLLRAKNLIKKTPKPITRRRNGGK